MNDKIEFTYVKGDIEGFIFEIDGAISMSDADIKKIPDDFLITLNKNDEYHYCFVPVKEHKKGINNVCWCSVDGKEWVTCVTAYIGEDSVDLYSLQEMLKNEYKNMVVA